MKHNILAILVGLFIGAAILFMLYYAKNIHTSPRLIQEFNFEGQQMTITVNFTDRETIRKRMAEINDLDLNDVPPVRAFATLRYNVNECDIYMVPIRHQNDSDAMETLGHEMLHCIYGRWHPGNEDYSTGDL